MGTPYGIIYIARNTVNGKVYVGQTTQPLASRWRHHLYTLKNPGRVPLRLAINKYGVSSFEVFELWEAATEQELNALEVRAISELSSAHPDFGYNATHGGQLSRQYTVGARERMRQAQLGKKLTNETREKISLTLRGRPSPMRGRPSPNSGRALSDEQKAKMSKALKGRVSTNLGKSPSEDVRRRISESLTGRPSPQRGVKRSEECRAKMSAAAKARKTINPFLGKEHSEEARLKMSEAAKARKTSNPFLGKTHSEEARRKMSEAAKARHQKQATTA